jgi:hypothetical protein
LGYGINMAGTFSAGDIVPIPPVPPHPDSPNIFNIFLSSQPPPVSEAFTPERRQRTDTQITVPEPDFDDSPLPGKHFNPTPAHLPTYTLPSSIPPPQRSPINPMLSPSDNVAGHERDLEANFSRNDSSQLMALIQPGINTCREVESDQEPTLESVMYREDEASNAADRQDSTQLLSINNLAAPTLAPVMPNIPAVPSDSGYGTAEPSISGANQKPISGLEEQVPQHEGRTPSPQTDFGLEKTEPTMSQTGEAPLADNASLEHPDAPEEQPDGARDDAGVDGVEDTKSVVSIPDSIGSQISTATSQPVSAAEKVISVLLARNTHLVPLYEEALGKMEASRFIDNYRKILKIFYVGLTQTASTRLEKESIQILRNRNRRITIAENIVNLVEPQPEEMPAQPSEDSLRNHTNFLEKWLAGNKGFTDLRTDVAPDSPNHSEAEPDDAEYVNEHPFTENLQIADPAGRDSEQCAIRHVIHLVHILTL